MSRRRNTNMSNTPFEGTTPPVDETATTTEPVVDAQVADAPVAAEEAAPATTVPETPETVDAPIVAPEEDSAVEPDEEPATEAVDAPTVPTTATNTDTTKPVKIIGGNRTKVKSKAVQEFDAIAEGYLSIMGQKTIKDEDKQLAVKKLMLMADKVLLSKEADMFEECFDFMRKNRAVMLVPSVITAGITKYAPKAKVTKLVQFYVTFQSMVESKLLGTPFTLNVTTIRRVFNNNELANWCITKRK